MPFSAGDKLGPYEIMARIGAGGMGEVYRGRDARVGRDVAIKVAGEQFSDRFEHEIRAVAALNHPNVCTLYDVGPNYLVMELVEGPTLAQRLSSGAVPLPEALHIARQIASGVEAAHAKGIIHRDLKPANIKVRPDGSVKVLDFGLAKIIREPAPASEPGDTQTVTIDPTRTGAVLGTAGYMAPEQARGLEVDKRADIWAFGVMLYEMVIGQRLFKGDSTADTIARVLSQEPDWDQVPVRVRRLIRACLEKDRNRRLRDIGDAAMLIEEDRAASPAGSDGRFSRR